MKNLKKMSRNEMKSITGGFACYYGDKFLGEYSEVNACIAAVNLEKAKEKLEPSGPIGG